MSGKRKRVSTKQGQGDIPAVRTIGGEAAARWAACGESMAVSAATEGALYHVENELGLFVLYADGSVIMAAQGHGVCVPPGGVANAATQLVAISLLGGPDLVAAFSHDEMVKLGRLKIGQKRETLS